MNNKKISVAEKYIMFLAKKGYAASTIKTYESYLKIFLTYCNKNPYKINKSDAKSFILNTPFTSKSQHNQAISAIKHFYSYILNVKNIDIDELQRPSKSNYLPSIIDKDHILNTLDSIENLKHKTILSLTYSVGLRRSEVINLKVSDIDSKRMQIFIRDSKGNKDRVVPLSENILLLLRSYARLYRPLHFLFPGQKKGTKYSETSCGNIVKKYLGEKYSMHSLRHSCATHLIELGNEAVKIQKLLGHNSIKTTQMYIHLSNQSIKNLTTI